MNCNTTAEFVCLSQEEASTDSSESSTYARAVDNGGLALTHRVGPRSQVSGTRGFTRYQELAASQGLRFGFTVAQASAEPLGLAASARRPGRPSPVCALLHAAPAPAKLLELTFGSVFPL